MPLLDYKKTLFQDESDACLKKASKFGLGETGLPPAYLPKDEDEGDDA